MYIDFYDENEDGNHNYDDDYNAMILCVDKE
jgi:hypothetical protein